jgi:hypothetical protein
MLGHVFSAYIYVPYVNANCHTPLKIGQAVTAQPTIHLDGTYVVPATIDIDGHSLTRSTTRLLREAQRKHGLSHFDCVAQLESFRAAAISRQLFFHQKTSLPQFNSFSIPRFTVSDCGAMWMLIKGYINHLCGAAHTDLRMGVAAPTTNFFGLSVTQSETQRKATINAPYMACQDLRKPED